MTPEHSELGAALSRATPLSRAIRRIPYLSRFASNAVPQRSPKWSREGHRDFTRTLSCPGSTAVIAAYQTRLPERRMISGPIDQRALELVISSRVEPEEDDARS